VPARCEVAEQAVDLGERRGQLRAAVRVREAWRGARLLGSSATNDNAST